MLNSVHRKATRINIMTTLCRAGKKCTEFNKPYSLQLQYTDKLSTVCRKISSFIKTADLAFERSLNSIQHLFYAVLHANT